MIFDIQFLYVDFITIVLTIMKYELPFKFCVLCRKLSEIHNLLFIIHSFWNEWMNDQLNGF